MSTINNILKEIKNLPEDRLNEVFQYVHEITLNTKASTVQRKKILSFAGIFGDMTNRQYSSFTSKLRKERKTMFNRKVTL